MRFAAGVEYDGSLYHGWQSQSNAVSVQDAVEEALARVADHPVRVQCAGRTDAGVHALHQVVHFDSSARRSNRSWVLGGNSNLPDSVNLLWVRPVSGDFHARFSATGRHYVYLLLTRPVRSALDRLRRAWVHQSLDLEGMRAGAEHLLGRHDFTSLRAVGCQAKSPIRTIRYLDIDSPEPFLIRLRIGADGFLHHMVRNIAGLLIAVGKGERSPDWVRDVLLLRDRREAGITAPPQGLYFAGVDYPPSFRIPRYPDLPGLD